MDELIQAVFMALSAGADIDQIHDAILEKGWSEDIAFLAIKGGENLYNALVKQQNDLLKEND